MKLSYIVIYSFSNIASFPMTEGPLPQRTQSIYPLMGLPYLIANYLGS